MKKKKYTVIEVDKETKDLLVKKLEQVNLKSQRYMIETMIKYCLKNFKAVFGFDR
ncbi:MAG: hypothetical protein GY804_02475 [Alphaproteobacteria bacterium]|nr:hypothetical protein [Alphaproteobacteria bacterium]